MRWSAAGLFATVLGLGLGAAWGAPEQGSWLLHVEPGSEYVGVSKSMYNGTEIRVKVKCDSPDDTAMVTVSWFLRRTHCYTEHLFYMQPDSSLLERLWQSPALPLRYGSGRQYPAPSVLRGEDVTVPCDHNIILPPVDGSNMATPATAATEAAATGLPPATPGKQRREADSSHQLLPSAGASTSRHSLPPLVSVAGDGIYLVAVRVVAANATPFSAEVAVEAVASYGYLSAVDYPLLVFYGTLCGVYAILSLAWLVLCFLRWRDLLRLQYWITAVLLIGLLEKAVFVAEYETVNERGYSTSGLLLFAEVVSCAKRTIARILVLIAALGFGIVKPRLGSLLHRIILLGILYFGLACVESTVRVLRPKTDPNKQATMAVIPLALLDSLICWWVFSALVATTRTLRLRRNPTKLTLYTHFTNVLAASVLASIIFMVWSMKFYKFSECVEDWKELWVDDAFWHLLFVLVLFAIMILWRPANNNQRFAFSPLLDDSDASDSEDETPTMGTLARDTTHRTRSLSNGSSVDLPLSQAQKTQQEAEDDLKWVDENIPSSLVDPNLTMLDSDEEILTTRFELSKMQ